MTLTIGVLALQGAFARHVESLKKLNVSTCLVKTPKDLNTCDALIIPGGESTTLIKQMHFTGIKSALLPFSKCKPILGTCAGAILMSKELQQGGGVSPLGLMNITTKRNSYGRQNDSFSANITLNFSERPSFEAIFIRAPSIEDIDSNVKVLASYKGSPILVQEELCLAATFHPELTKNQRIHEYLLHLTTQNKL